MNHLCMVRLVRKQILSPWSGFLVRIFFGPVRPSLRPVAIGCGGLNWIAVCISVHTCTMSVHANIGNNVVEYVPLRKSLDRSFNSWLQKFPIHWTIFFSKISRISEFLSGVLNNLKTSYASLSLCIFRFYFLTHFNPCALDFPFWTRWLLKHTHHIFNRKL